MLRTRTDHMVAHVSATRPTQDFGAKDIDAMHRARGWSGIGYAAVIRLDGREEIGRGYDKVGAHVEGWNSVSFGVCIIGGLDRNGRAANTMNAAQEATLEKIFRRESRNYPKATICGHRDLSPDKDRDGVIEPHEWLKECPCFDAIPWARSKGLPAARIRGVWDKTAPAIADKPVPDARNIYLQKLLAMAGYHFGAVDGIVGERTEGAIRQYQRWAGLPVTGAFDAATVKNLRARFERSAA